MKIEILKIPEVSGDTLLMPKVLRNGRKDEASEAFFNQIKCKVTERFDSVPYLNVIFPLGCTYKGLKKITTMTIVESGKVIKIVIEEIIQTFVYRDKTFWVYEKNVYPKETETQKNEFFITLSEPTFQ